MGKVLDAHSCPMDMVDCPVKTCRKHGTGGKVLDVHSYPMDKVDSPMWTQYFDGKLGHVWRGEAGEGLVQFLSHQTTRWAQSCHM